MADKDEHSLELPSFRLRRRRESPPDQSEAQSVDDATTMVHELPPSPVAERGPAVEDPAQPRARSLRLPTQLAAAVTGLAVGVAAVGLVWVGQRGCEAMSGTSSCGRGPGLLVLLVVVVALTLLGAALLRVLGADHAGSTSTLAVGIATVLTLLVFADALFEVRGAVFVALTVVVAYAVAHAVTSAAGD